MDRSKKRRSTFRLAPILAAISTLIIVFCVNRQPPAIFSDVMANQKETKGEKRTEKAVEEVVITGKETLSSPNSYNPKKCLNLVDGHCDDKDGGAWTYQNKEGNCTYIETSATSNNAPRDHNAVLGLPNLFPNIESVLDFGGGVGVYLTGFRNAGVSKLVTVEPHPFGPCIFAGIQQDTTDWINTPLDKLPNKKYDLVMTIEVAEHVPVNFHPHLLQALAQATKKWLFFSAAHPGQDGEGHIGPSMKTREQWIQEIHNWTSFRFDAEKTKELQNITGYILQTNSAIFSLSEK
jgi:Methyltransferase domain